MLRAGAYFPIGRKISEAIWLTAKVVRLSEDGFAFVLGR